MPEVNTNTNTNGSISAKEWKMRKTFIDAYRQKLITRTEFCVLWSACQMVDNFFNQAKEGAE